MTETATPPEPAEPQTDHGMMALRLASAEAERASAELAASILQPTIERLTKERDEAREREGPRVKKLLRRTANLGEKLDAERVASLASLSENRALGFRVERLMAELERERRAHGELVERINRASAAAAGKAAPPAEDPGAAPSDPIGSDDEQAQAD